MSHNHLVLVSHFTKTPGMVHKLRDYFSSKKFHVTTILHPLHSNENLDSSITTPSQTVIFRTNRLFEGISGAVRYTRLIDQPQVDAAICFDPLSFLHVHIFNFIFKARKIVYYNLDFSLDRFPNPILNFVYRTINFYAYKKSDLFLCPSPKFAEILDPHNKFSHKAKVVPHTVRMPQLKTKRKPGSMVFAGTLSKTVNFKPLINALARLDAKIAWKLDIYGRGENEVKIQKMIKDKNLSNKIEFKGIVDNNTLTHKVLPTYKVGLAPYCMPGDKNAPDHMFHGTDLTSKIVEYMAAGLPVISTRLYDAFKELEKHQSGISIAKKTDWKNAIESLLTDDVSWQKMHKNATKHAKEYDIDNIWNHIVEDLLS